MPTAWFIAGATATGKSAVAQRLAEQLGCAILSADSMLVYRGMDIGTAKPTPAERGAVPYSGIDLVTPDQPFSTGLWLAAVRSSEVLKCESSKVGSPRTPELPNFRTSELPHSRTLELPHFRTSQLPLIVAGGTGLYIKALTDGIDGEAADPEARARWQTLHEREGADALRRALEARAPGALAALPDAANPRRLLRALEHLDARGTLPAQWKAPPAAAPVPVLRLPREQLHARIARRVAAMFKAGLIDEVRALRRDFPVWSDTARRAIGYAEACALLDGTLTEREAIEQITIRTRQLAKRQETWFRHQAQSIVIDIEDTDPPEHVARRVLDTWRKHGPTNVLPL